MFSEQDKEFMQQAIALAAKGRFTTSPNPNVGCVIVKDGDIVGQGYHQKAGEGHAEVHALKMAGDKARGATAYVTLEPCSHYGRTPPCAKGLIDAGVSRVVAAMVDPNPEVAGRGLRMLEETGIETAAGLFEQEARALNPGFLTRMETGLPYISCKLAASLDGKTALKNGESKWITSSAARQDVQLLRAEHCAVLSGADTVLFDDAKLNVRLSAEQLKLAEGLSVRQPIRVIIDSQNRLYPDLALFSINSPIIILRTKADTTHQWPEHVTELLVDSINGKVDIKKALKQLTAHGINSVFVEAGATLAGKFHELNLIDNYILYLAPKIMGQDARGLFNVPELTQMADVKSLKWHDIKQVGDDIRLTARKVAQKG